MQANKAHKNLAQVEQRCHDVMQQTAGLTDMPVGLIGDLVIVTGYLPSVWFRSFAGSDILVSVVCSVTRTDTTEREQAGPRLQMARVMSTVKHHMRLQDETVFGHSCAGTQHDLGCLATERFRHRPRQADSSCC